MKSPQHHAPQMDFPQAALPALASAVARRPSYLWVQAKHDPRRIPIGFHLPDPVIVDAVRLTLPYTAAVLRCESGMPMRRHCFSTPDVLEPLIPRNHVGAS
jgi:hypothetical protein